MLLAQCLTDYEMSIIALFVNDDTIRYDTIAEFNVDSKAEYSA